MNTRFSLRALGRVLVRVVVVMVVAGVIVGCAMAIGSSPVASALPATFIPSATGSGRPEGAAPDQNGGAAPQRRGPPAGQGQAAAAGVPQGQPPQGIFGGRNAPSLQRGGLEEVRYVAIFAVLTGVVALLIRVIRPKRRAPVRAASDA
jgi:hypothetical protein